MNVEIAQRLAELRRKRGYSQEELAEKLGLSRQAVSKWERAESSPDTGNLVALAKLYGVTIDELLRFEEDIEDDIKFEAKDRTASAEARAQEAAEQASVAAAQASAAAAQIQAAGAQVAAAQIAASPHSDFRESGAQYAGTHAAEAQPAGSQAHHAIAAGPADVRQPTQPFGTQPDQTSGSTQPVQSQSVDNAEKHKGPWSSFPYPIVCVILYLFAGFFLDLWHPGWIIFLTIPIYYYIAHVIETDPNYRR